MNTLAHIDFRDEDARVAAEDRERQRLLFPDRTNTDENSTRWAVTSNRLKQKTDPGGVTAKTLAAMVKQAGSLPSGSINPPQAGTEVIQPAQIEGENR